MSLIVRSAEEIAAEVAAQEAATKRAAALAYLKETDWVVIRSVESQTPIPDEILAKREQARKDAS